MTSFLNKYFRLPKIVQLPHILKLSYLKYLNVNRIIPVKKPIKYRNCVVENWEGYSKTNEFSKRYARGTLSEKQTGVGVASKLIFSRIISIQTQGYIRLLKKDGVLYSARLRVWTSLFTVFTSYCNHLDKMNSTLLIASALCALFALSQCYSFDDDDMG